MMADHASRAALVARARLWLGTPYCHRASLRGAGCDCLGLIRGLWRETRGPEPETLPPYAAGWVPEGDERLLRALAQHMEPVPVTAPLRPAQVLLFRLRPRRAAQHLGLLAAPGRFIHAHERHGVIESPLSAPWANRVVARFELI